jgi:hypothetical protein
MTWWLMSIILATWLRLGGSWLEDSPGCGGEVKLHLHGKKHGTVLLSFQQ